MEDTGPDANAAASWIKRNINWFVIAVALVVIIFPRVSPFEGLNEVLRAPARLSEWILEKLERLFANYGYWVVFIGVLLENSMFLGLLVPGAIILILAGLAAENGAINLWFVLALGITATIIGDTMSYFIGRMGWTRVLERGGMGKMMDRVRVTMEANSTWLILAYHFAGYSRVVGPAAAGLFRIPYRRWAPLDYIGGTAWVIVYTMVGFALGLAGLEFGDTKSMVRFMEFFFTGILIAMVVLAWYRTSRMTRPPEAPPESSAGPRAPGGHPAIVIVPVNDE